MMSKTVLALLLVCAVLLQGSHAFWTRRQKLKIYLPNGKRIAEKLKSSLPVFGKRDAEEGEVLPDVVRQQLEENCPALLGIVENSSDQDLLQAAISESDADGDGALSGNEMETFTQFLETIEICQEFDAQTDGGQP